MIKSYDDFFNFYFCIAVKLILIVTTGNCDLVKAQF